MSDDDAYMALALNNAQGELSPLEIGLHAIGSPLTDREYAKALGISEQTLSTRVKSARVADAVTDIGNLSSVWSHLAELHAAPRWLWPALVSALIANDWTVDLARKAAQKTVVPRQTYGSNHG